MFRTATEWEALELAAAERLASARKKLPEVTAAASVILTVVLFYGYWSSIFAFLERLF